MPRVQEPHLEGLPLLVRGPLQALAAGLGSDLTEASRTPWGDTRSIYRLVLADGRIVAARHLMGSNAHQRAKELVRRIGRLVASGIEVAHPAEVSSADEEAAWILTPWVDGVVGAAALQSPRSAIRLAEQMGRLAGRIASVDADGLDLNGHWTGPGQLAAAGAGWLAELELSRETRLGVNRSFGNIVSAWDESTLWRVGTSHGDFAPINVIIGRGDALVLLDLDDLQLGPRLFDVAWWGWVVRYHHPNAWARAWPALVAGAGLDDGAELDAAATAVARVRVLERAAKAPDVRVRSLWLRRLDQTAEW